MSKSSSHYEQNGRSDDKGQKRVLFGPIEARRDKAPKLIADHGRGDAKAKNHRYADQNKEFLLWRRENQLRDFTAAAQNFGNGLGQKIQDIFGDEKTGEQSNNKSERRADQACAQLS